MLRWTMLAAGLMAVAPASAQSQPPTERDLCTDRPGLGTPACTIDKGRVVLEVGLADWTRDDGAGSREDSFLFGDALARIGISDTVELELGLTSLGYQHTRDATGVSHATRIGDAFVGAKFNLSNPDGSHFSAALLPYATLPTGRQPIGAGDWGAGLIVPVSYELSESLELQASPEIDAAVDADGNGRHTAYGSTVGLGFSVSGSVSGAIEYQGIRDRDPSGYTTQSLAGLSFAWQRSGDLQFDIGSNIGLNRDTSDIEVYFGVSKRF